MSSLPSQLPRLRPGSGETHRIDRLGWTSGISFDAYGLRVGVRSNEAGLLDRLMPLLPPGWTPARSPLVDQLFSLWVDEGRTPLGERAARLFAGPRRVWRAASLDEALGRLESDIRQGVAAGARRRTFVHAGVVGHAGRAIVIPGRSRSGKTTLVAELVKAGASYYSDEFAVLDGRGRVHPFAKPLSVRGEGGCDQHARRTLPHELGGESGRDPLPVGLVILASYRPGGDFRPVSLTAGEAVLEMLAHTVPARLRPETSLRALERVARRAAVLRSERGEAAPLAARLLEMMTRQETARISRRRLVGEGGTR